MTEIKTSLKTPKWTPTQHGPAYMITAEGTEPSNVPGQRVVGQIRDDRHHRRVVEISTTHLPYELWINNAGDVLQLPVKTTRVLSKKGWERGHSADESAYIVEQRNIHWQAGWLHYDIGAYGEDREHWLARREKEIADRRGLQAEDMAEAAKRFDAEKNKDEVREAIGDAAGSMADGAADRARRAAKRAKLDTGEL